MTSRFVLGTRGSELALWQARHVAARLRGLDPPLRVEERILRTAGDREPSARLDALGGRGVFVRELEAGLLGKRIDLAVHSLKDLPTSQPQGLVLAAVLERHDPRDAVVSREGWTLEELPRGATVATGSYRRRCQLLHARPDLRVVPVRGNVPTRVRKLSELQFDALVLAVAGIERLGITSVPARPIPLEVCLPAVGQGALVIEVRSRDRQLVERLRALNHAETSREVRAERAWLRRLGGGCLAPATGHAVVDGGRLRLEAVVGDPDGRRLLRDAIVGPATDADGLGQALAERMLAAGAAELLRLARTTVPADAG